MRSVFRGLRLGPKLLLLGLPLALLVPWLALLLLEELERLSVQMQSNQQRLIAESIAISFNGREDWFTDLPVDAAAQRTRAGVNQTLVARPIESALRPRLDGSMEDWKQQAAPARFGEGDGAFRLSLGTQENVLYAYLEVRDDVRVYRDPEVLRLNNADQVRLQFIEPNGDDGRISVTLAESGGTTAYRMDADWRYAAGGLPESAVQGQTRETSEGYAIELRMPYAILGSWRLFGISFVDVDDSRQRTVRGIVHTGESNLAAYRSPVLLKLLEGLGYSAMHILVIDAEGRIRAETGSFSTPVEVAQVRSWLATALSRLTTLGATLAPGPSAERPASQVEAELRAATLAGQPAARRRRVGDVETIVAGHHIVSTQGDIIGMVAVEQNIDDILRFQYEAVDRIAFASLASLFLVPLCLVGFAGRLAWRIRALRREAGAAIDQHGRLRTASLGTGTAAADEIGDLARSIAAMLARLEQHNTFLKRMPRTLRHEINNPLNALNTSLEHLSQHLRRGDKYLDSAKRGILRIGAIVENLAEAASLEESLAVDDLEMIDVQALLASYVGHCRTAHRQHEFAFRGLPGPAYANVADYRIEQLLDKLVDNAIDFHRAGSAIRIQLDVRRDQLRLVVANRGPLFPTDDAALLFESMGSHRADEAKAHFGLGLYVVRVIAEQHGGTARAVNLQDGSGVAVAVYLPLAVAPEAEAGASPLAKAASAADRAG